MPCSCSGVRLKNCNCKLLPKNFLGADVVFVHRGEKRSIFIRFLETLYEKCAGYNLRYCPLRGVTRCDKCLTTAFKDLMVLFCFLVANSIVFLNILTKITVHVCYLFGGTANWICSRFTLKAPNNGQLLERNGIYFEPLYEEHNYKKPETLKLF